MHGSGVGRPGMKLQNDACPRSSKIIVLNIIHRISIFYLALVAAAINLSFGSI